MTVKPWSLQELWIGQTQGSPSSQAYPKDSCFCSGNCQKESKVARLHKPILSIPGLSSFLLTFMVVL